MQVFDRRTVMRLSAATGAALSVTSLGEGAERSLKIVDTNVHLSLWPFRRLPLDRADKLAEKLTSLGIHQAWVCSYEALLHRDLRTVNARLAAAAALHKCFVPIGALNPVLPDWREDLRVCIDSHKMLGVRIYPNYHQYTLASPEFRQLLKLCSEHRLLLQIAVAMEDSRTQHPMARVADVDLTPLPEILKRVDHAQVQLLNYRPTGKTFDSLSKAPRLYFDTARVESTDGVPRLAKAVPQRTLFGSHAPLLIPEAALIRVHESSQLATEELRAVYATNAQTLLSALATKAVR